MKFIQSIHLFAAIRKKIRKKFTCQSKQETTYLPRKDTTDDEWVMGAGIMEADDRQVTTGFTVQPSFHHRHSTNRVS